MLDPKTGLYEPVELTDVLGTRFLVRKVKDDPPHVPPLDQVRSEVIVAWKMAKARPLAEKAAEELAARLKAKPAAANDATVDRYHVLHIPAITRSQTNFMGNSMMEPGSSLETPIPGVPYAGERFRDAYFGLQAGTPSVAPNEPKTAYYVMTLDRREPVTFSALYGAANSDEFRYKSMVREEAAKRQDEEWMAWLRQQAGLKPDWIPPDEAKKDEAARG